jgi:hypothetical protein
MLDPAAAKALAAISTERYFDPCATIAAQGLPANKWFLPIHGEYCSVRDTASEYSTAAYSTTTAADDAEGPESHCGIKMKPTEEDITPHWHKHDGMFLYTGDDREHAHRLAAIVDKMQRPMGLCNAPLCLGDAIAFAVATENACNEAGINTGGGGGGGGAAKRGSVFAAAAARVPKVTTANYSSSLRSPGHTQVLQIDALGTWNLMKG